MGAGLVATGGWERNVLATSMGSAMIRSTVGVMPAIARPPNVFTPDTPPEFIQQEAADVLIGPGLQALPCPGMGNTAEQL